jgi:hypothetical protein
MHRRTRIPLGKADATNERETGSTSAQVRPAREVNAGVQVSPFLAIPPFTA